LQSGLAVGALRPEPDRRRPRRLHPARLRHRRADPARPRGAGHGPALQQLHPSAGLRRLRPEDRRPAGALKARTPRTSTPAGAGEGARQPLARPRHSPSVSELRIGCSGWSYKDWTGAFYPAGTKDAGRLEYYAAWFDTAEINASFYRLPSEAAVAGWARRAPPGFVFAWKVSRFITHN